MIAWGRLALISIFAFSAILGINAMQKRSTINIESEPIEAVKASIPVAPREMRAMWVATVNNIDWPSSRTLTSEQQKAELLAILDKAVELRMNTVIFQVRPACDALYESKIEPWSEYLTGQMGKAPEPFYDPLAFVVEEAHKRGLELHAWFNPYRARYTGAKTPASPDHVSLKRPQLVKKYGGYLWLDPSQKAVQDYSRSVVMDVVKRYDIDGVHIDDYFYPYKERDDKKKIIDFPDDESWKSYQSSGGKLSRSDWRRSSVDVFVKNLYSSIKKEKSWVKFGISPFGIWRPGYPSIVKGLDAYEELYADSKKWLNEGWLDYFTPQIYFKIDAKAQPFPKLLEWWQSENTKNRLMCPGLFTSQVANGENGWRATEIANQIRVTRAAKDTNGHVHFSARAFMQNRGDINLSLGTELYAQPALLPSLPWLDKTPPPAPKAKWKRDSKSEANDLLLSWTPGDKSALSNYVLYIRRGGGWNWVPLPASQTTYRWLGNDPSGLPEYVALSSIDRFGNESVKTLLRNEDATQ